MAFEPGHKKMGGRPKGGKDKSTVWVLDSLKKRGVDYEKMLADALKIVSCPLPDGLNPLELKAAICARDSALEILDRLIKLAPHIANKPKEHVAMEGVDELVIKEYKEEKK